MQLLTRLYTHVILMCIQNEMYIHPYYKTSVMRKAFTCHYVILSVYTYLSVAHKLFRVITPLVYPIPFYPRDNKRRAIKSTLYNTRNSNKNLLCNTKSDINGKLLCIILLPSTRNMIACCYYHNACLFPVKYPVLWQKVGLCNIPEPTRQEHP